MNILQIQLENLINLLVCHPQNEFGHRQNKITVYMCKQGMYYEPIVLLLSREQVVQELQNPEDTPLKRELEVQYYQVSDLPMIIKLRYFSTIKQLIKQN